MAATDPARRRAAAVDGALARVAESFDYLLAVTPVNADDAWTAFRANGARTSPVFSYAEPVGLERLRGELAAVPDPDVDDTDLAALFEAKRREIGLWLDLAGSLGEPAFLQASLELYGGVDDDLLDAAEQGLTAIPLAERAAEPGGDLDGVEFAALAQREVDAYRAVHPSLPTRVSVDPSFPGVMVSGPDLIVGPDHRVARARAEALVQHEVGTHVVTNVNGTAQPLRLLAAGLPGYEETQEGLAVLAEYAAGGLTGPRLAVIAARVLATRRMLDGAAFPEVFGELVDAVGLHEDRAWEMVMRTWRGGGLTKDVIYLRGLAGVLRHLAAGGEVAPLTVGKLDLAQLPVLARLRDRGWVRPPVLRPRWLDLPGAAERLATARAGTLESVTSGLWRSGGDQRVPGEQV